MKNYTLFAATQLCLAGALPAALVVTDDDILDAPVSIQVSSNHQNSMGDGTSYPGTALTDGLKPTASEIGTTSDSTAWATNSVNFGIGWVVLDMGSAQNYAGMLYAQRGSGGGVTTADVWHKTDIWVSNVNPGDPGGWNNLHADPTGTLIADDLVLSRQAGTLVQYDFNNVYNGQYLIFKFSMYDDVNDTNMVTQFQPGGNDLWMVTAVPEPSAAVLLGLGGLGVMFRRRRA